MHTTASLSLGVLLLASAMFSGNSFAQSTPTKSQRIVGWITYDRTTSEAFLTECSSKYVFRMWQSQAEVQRTLKNAEQTKVAHYPTPGTVLVNATVEGARFTGHSQCRPSTGQFDGCMILIKVIETRESTRVDCAG